VVRGWLQRDNANLDFLRATAVLCVVIFHLLLYRQQFVFGIFNLHTLGTWGVLMFFVHTSLVLMLSLERQPAYWSPARHYGVFWIRRCFRLLPLSMTIVLLIYCLRLPLNYSSQQFRAVAFTPTLLFSNLLLIQDITHVDSIESPLWSLPYEMQMYVCLPLLFYFVTRSLAWWPVTVLFVGSMVVAVLAGGAVRIPMRFPAIPWDLLNYVPCFLAGVVAFQLYRMRSSVQPEQPSRGLPAFLWPLFVLGVTATFLLTARYGTRWVSPRWLGCLTLGIGIPFFRPIRAPWLTRTSATVARYSYGIYRTHFFCLWLAFDKLAPLSALTRWTCFVAVVVLLPLLFYHLIEAPLARIGIRVVDQLFPGSNEKGVAVGDAAPVVTREL